MELSKIQCPYCLQWLDYPIPPVGEDRDVELDYDCEVCCRPLLVIVSECGAAEVRGVSE